MHMTALSAALGQGRTVECVNRSQRIVIVIAVGVALAVAVQTVNGLLFETRGGWFGYAPGTNAVFSADAFDGARGDTLARAAVWLCAVVTWAGLSAWLLRSPKSGSD